MVRNQLFYLILAIVLAQLAKAATLEELITAGELEAQIVVKTLAPLYQKAPVEFAVTVGTPNEFKNGTRVRDFTIPGSLVRPISKFAFNDSEVIDGITWKFQSWSFELFSERTGTLDSPALTTFISVETEAHGLVEGEISLQIPALEIEVPPGTEALSSWIAANEFEVEESWEGELDRYEVGDAITRIRRFTVKGAPAMAIPASPKIELQSVQVYGAPTLVDDKAVGGSLQGVREERVVLTVKSGGSFTIPEYSIHWFNLKTGAVEPIDFPARSFEVAGPVASQAATAAESKGEARTFPWKWALPVPLVALCWLLLRWILRTAWYRSLLRQIEIRQAQRQTKAAFMRAAAQQDGRACLALLYRCMAENADWQLSAVCASDPQLSEVSAALMEHVYGDGPAPGINELQQLWAICIEPNQLRDKRKSLWLNPGPRQ